VVGQDRVGQDLRWHLQQYLIPAALCYVTAMAMKLDMQFAMF
jgi:hypothetical protein